MVAVVSGSGLGLFGSSASVLGGVHGNAGLGRGTDRLYINSATGNLVVQSVDESLAALGLDVSLVRTYNSQGLMDDDNGDNWRLGVHQRLYDWTGTINTAGSTVTKVFGDGSEVVYRYNDELDAYVSTDGDGAHDTIAQDGTDWVWTEGSSRATETYDANGRLQSTADVDGNEVEYVYDDDLLTEIHDSSGQQTFLDYVGNDLAAIRVVSNGQTQTLTRYYYDSLHRLRQVVVDLTPADNAAALADANSDGIFEAVDDEAYVTTYTYDGTSKRVASITQSDGTYVAFTYEEVEGTYRVKTYATSAAGASGVGTSDERLTTLSYSGAGMTAEESVLSTTDTVTTTTNYALDQTLFPPSWSTPELLEDSPVGALNPQVAFDALGNGLAVWAQGSDVFARRYTAATNTWGSIVTLDSASDSTSAPKLAIDRNTGDAIVAWGGADGTFGRLSMSRFTASTGSWSTATELAEWEGTGLWPSQVSVSMSGHYAVVAWAQGTESNRELLQVVIKHGEPSDAQLLESNGEPVDHVQVQVDSNGNALTVWRQSDLTANRVFFNRWRDATQAYSGPTLLDTLGDGGSWPKLQFDAQGNALAVWGQWNGLQARRFDAVTNSWGPAVAVQTSPGDFFNWELASDEQGNALVAWVAGDWQSLTVYARRFDAATGEWGTTAAVNSGGVNPDDALSVSISGSNAVVAWLHVNGSGQNDVYSARLRNGTWSAEQLLDSRAEGTTQVNAAVDDNGRISVLWQQADGFARSIYEGRFDNSGHSYTVPSGATWQSIANALYGINSAAAGDALRIALGNPTLTTGAQLNDLPPTLSVSVTQTATVPAYYVVQSNDTWTSITEAIYGTDDPFVVAELQELLDNPPLIPGMHLTVPLVLNSTRTHVVDPLGNVTTYIKNSSGRLFAVLAPEVDGHRQQTYYDYDYDGNVTVITEDPANLNRTTTFEYDEHGNLIKTRDASGTTVTHTYNANNQVLSETRYRDVDADGFGPATPTDTLTARYVYDSENHLRFTVSAAGHVIEHRYNAVGQRVTTLNHVNEGYFELTISESELESFVANKPSRERTDYAYDFRGNLETVSVWPETDWEGAGVGTPSVTRFVYDQRGRLLQTIQPRGESTPESGDYSTTFTYDGLGRLLTTTQWIWNGESRTTLNDYDDADNRTVTTLENGASTLVTTALYNGAGELINVTASTGLGAPLGTTTYIYDAAGRLCVTTDPVGVRTYMVYDGAGRQVGAVDGDGTLTQFFYSPLGQLVKTVQYGDRLGSEVLDALLNNEDEPDPDEYHIYALLVGLDNVPGRNPARDRITRQAFDSAGKLAFTIDEVGAVVGYKYDGAGRILEQVQYANAVEIPSHWDFLQARDVEVQIDPAHDRRTRNFYDNDNNLRGTLDPAGYLVEFKYNAAGRLIEEIAYATPTDELMRESGSLDDLRPALDNTNEPGSTERDIRSRYFYDGRGRLVGELDGENYLTETYYGINFGDADLVQMVMRYDKQLTYQDGDTLSDLKQQIQYTDSARTTHYRYNGAGEVVKETVQVGTELVYSSTATEFGYDLAGRVVRVTRGYDSQVIRTTRVRYDALGRVVQELTAEGNARIEGGLAEETAWEQYSVTHTYNHAGRRTSTADQYGNRTVFYYDDDGRLAYTVNALGEVQHSRYDALGRLSETITYDRRISTDDLDGGRVSSTDIESRIFANPSLDSRTAVTYEYIGGGERITTTTAEGASTETLTDAFGDLIRREDIRAGEARQHKYVYDQRGLLSETRWDPNVINRIETREYDAFGRVTATADQYGNTYRTEYDALGRVLATVDPLNARRSVRYDGFSRQVEVTGATLNSTVAYSYDEDGDERTMTMTTAEGVVVKTTYNVHGETIRVVTNEDGGPSTWVEYGYDANGQLSRVYDEKGDRVISEYDRAGRLHLSTDGNGSVTEYQYDGASRVFTKTEGVGTLNLTTQYDYYDITTNRRILRTTEANGIVTETLYDRDGRLSTVTVDPDGADETITSYQYDDANNTTTVIEGYGRPEARRTDYQFDGLGRRIVEIVDPGTVPDHLNLTTRYRYDANGNLTRKIDAEEHSTWYVYDDAGRLAFTIDALGGITEISRDEEGRVEGTRRLATVTTAVNGWVTNDVDMVTTEDFVAVPVDSLDSYEQTLYDLDGRAVFSVNPMGGVTHRTFDANGNVTREVLYNADIPVTTYEEAEDVSDALLLEGVDVDAAPGPQDRVRWTTYDARNRPVYSVDGLGYVTKTEYDAADNVTRVIAFTDPFVGDATDVGDFEDFEAANATDADNRITRYWYDGANRLRFTLDAEGWLTEVQYSEATREQVEVSYYAKMGGATITDTTTYAQLDSAVDPSGNTNNQIVTTHYDAAGRIDLVTDEAGSESYEYDDVGNRIAFTNKNDDTWNYIYDANGRLLEEWSPEVDITSITAGAQLTAEPTEEGRIVTRMTYDDLGNVTHRLEGLVFVGTTEISGSSRLTEYRYDKLGRQIRVDFPDAEVYNYDYDPNVPGSQRTVWRNDLHTETTYDALGNATRSLDISGRYSYKAYDRLGRVTHELDSDIRAEDTDPSVHYVTRREYDAFGNVTSLTRYAGSIENPVFTTDRLDAAQLATKVSALEANVENRTITTAYDRLNRVAYVKQPAVHVVDTEAGSSSVPYTSAPITSFKYNAFGDVIRESRLVRGDLVDENNPDPDVTNAWAHTYRYYDRRGNKIAEVDPERYLSKFTYNDASGDLTGRYEYATKLTSVPTDLSIVPEGVPVLPPLSMSLDDLQPATGYDRQWSYSYDKMNRLTEERLESVQYAGSGGSTYQIGTAIVSYQYDALGNQTVVTSNGASTYTYYDALGRVTGVAQPRRALGDGANFTPFTRLYRDVYGNLVRQVQFARDVGEASSTLPNITEDGTTERVTLFKLDAYGRAKQTQDANGAQRYAAYNERGDIASEWQWVSNIDPDAVGEVWVPEELTTTYHYDSLGRQTRIVEPRAVGDDRDSWAHYNAFGEITEKGVVGFTDTEYFYYDNAGRVWNTNNGNGVNKVYRYDLAGNITTELISPDLALDLKSYLRPEDLNESTLGTLRRTDMVYDRLGRLTEKRDPQYALLSSQHEALDGEFNVGIDFPGYLTFPQGYQLYAEQTTATFTYRVGNGSPISMTVEPLGVILAVDISNLAVGDYTYELIYSLNGVEYAKSAGTLSITGPSTGTITDELTAEALIVGSARVTQIQESDRWGNVVSMTGANTKTTQYRYNQLDQLVAIEQPLVTVVDTTDSSIDEASDNPTSYNRYDLYGRLIATQDARGNVNRIEYNAVGQKLTEINADDAQFLEQSRKHYVYDGFGQQIVSHEDGYETRYRYDGVGQLERMAREVSQNAFDLQASSWFPTVSASNHGYVVYTYEYDEAGRRIWETTGEFMDGSTTVEEKRLYWYDEHDNLTRVREPRGIFTLDISGEDDPVMRFETRYAYDADGNKISEMDGNGSVMSWTYDRFKRVRSHEQMSNTNPIYGSEQFASAAGATITYNYDGAGMLKTQTSTLGQNITYRYDGAGHLTGITERSAGFGSVPDGGPVAPGRPLLFGVERDTEYSYDAYGRRIRERLVVEGQEHQDAIATYDDLDRLLSVDDRRSTVDYSYDAAGNRTRIQSTFQDNANGWHSQDLWYVYDSMNRVQISQGTDSGTTVTISGAPDGLILEYDARGYRSGMQTNGQRVFVLDGSNFSLNAGIVKEAYFYDGLGRLILTQQEQDEWSLDEPIVTRLVDIDVRHYDRASRLTSQETRTINPMASAAEWRQVELRYDDNGRLTSQYTYDNYDRNTGARTAESAVIYGSSWYNGDYGYEVDLPEGGVSGAWPSAWAPGFDAAGVLRGYVVTTWNGNSWITTNHTFEYRLGESYQEVRHHAQSHGSTQNGTPLPGSTTSIYNVNGELVSFRDDQATMNTAQKNRLIANNAAGQAVTAISGIYHYDPEYTNWWLFRTVLEPTDGIPTIGSQMNRYFNGQLLGTFGHLQQETGTFVGNFDVNYTPISDHYPTATPSEVTVQAGDTLRAIAQRLFGDGSLWYVLSEANGLQMGPDTEMIDQVGWPLRVPNEVVSMSNTNTSFKPFNIGDVLGDTSPTQPMPPPPPPKKKGCGVIGMILIVVVAIVVTVFTAGVAAGGIGSTAGVWSTGASALAGGSVGGLGAVGASIVGGAVGSAASQGIAIAAGMQEGFDWKGVAMGAIGAGVTAGLGAAGLGGNVASGLGFKEGSTAFRYASLAANGAASSALTQGISVATGLQSSFNWRDVAISAVAAPVAAAAGAGANKLIGWDFATKFVSGVAGSSVRRAFGGKVDTASILADAFGNALGNSMVDSLVASDQAIAGRVDRLNERAEELGVTIDQKEARRIAAEEHKLSKNPERFDAGRQDQHVDRVLKLFGASAEDRAAIAGQLTEARAPAVSAAAAPSMSELGTETQPAPLEEVVVHSGELSGFGKFLNEWQDPLATAGRLGTKVGQFIEEHSWAKWGLTAVEAITSPALFAGRTLFQATALGASFNDWLGDKSDQIMATGTEYVDDAGWIDNLQKSAQIVGGLMLGVGLVVGGAKLFTKLATKIGGFFGKVASREAKDLQVVDKSWKAKIDGTAQATGNDATHQIRTYREAIRLAKDPNVESVHLDHGYNRALDLDRKTISPNRRPDVLALYKNKDVGRVEVQSTWDDPAVLRSRNAALDAQIRAQGYNPLPPVVVRPTRAPR